MKQLTDMSFCRTTPTTRGGYFPVPGNPLLNRYLGKLTRLRESVEDSMMAGHTKSLLMRKLDQCAGSELSPKVKTYVINTVESLLKKDELND